MRIYITFLVVTININTAFSQYVHNCPSSVMQKLIDYPNEIKANIASKSNTNFLTEVTATKVNYTNITNLDAKKNVLDLLRDSPYMQIDESTSTLTIIGKDEIKLNVNKVSMHLSPFQMYQYFKTILLKNVASLELVIASDYYIKNSINTGIININLK
jgi:hypothetical protein